MCPKPFADSVETKKILFGSPEEPSGASWLLNCFLELDIKICHKPVVDSVWRNASARSDPCHMWRADGDAFVLMRKADMIKKWIPALSNRERFHFRGDAEVEYVQDFAEDRHDDHAAIFFVRDPRDALYSMYRRARPELDFESYLRIPNARSLLDRIENWSAQVRSWQQLAGCRFYSFEDYKADAQALLARIIGDLGIARSHQEIVRAASESTFEKAKMAEATYRLEYPHDDVVANRAGKIGDWRENPEIAMGIESIERRAGAVMQTLGYTAPAWRGELPAVERSELPDLVSFFNAVKRPPSSRVPIATPEPEDSALRDALRFAERVDSALLRASNLAPDEICILLDGLAALTARCNGIPCKRVQTLRDSFANGSAYHFERLRTLVKQRRRTP